MEVNFFSLLVKIQITGLTNKGGIDLHLKPNHCQLYRGHGKAVSLLWTW